MFFHILKISGFPEHHGLAQPAKEWVVKNLYILYLKFRGVLWKAVQMNVTWSWLKASGTNSDSRPGLCRHMECVPPRMRMVTPRVERSMHLVVLFEVTTSRHFDVTRMQIFHRCFLLKFSFRLLLIFVKIFGRQQLGERRAGERHAKGETRKTKSRAFVSNLQIRENSQSPNSHARLAHPCGLC